MGGHAGVMLVGAAALLCSACGAEGSGGPAGNVTLPEAAPEASTPAQPVRATSTPDTPPKQPSASPGDLPADASVPSTSADIDGSDAEWRQIPLDAVEDDDLTLFNEAAAGTPESVLDYLAAMDGDDVAEEFAEVGGRACALDLVRLTITYSQFVVTYGYEPRDIDELTDALDLPTLELYSVDADGTRARPLPGTACIEQPLFDSDSDERCTDEQTRLENATREYQVRFGAMPESVGALLEAGIIIAPERYYGIEDGVLVNIPDWPCPDAAAGDPAICDVEFATLSTAVEAYFAIHASYPVDEQQLVDDGLIPEVLDLWDVVNGDLIAARGSSCTYPSGE